MKINHWDGYVLVCFHPSDCPSDKSVWTRDCDPFLPAWSGSSPVKRSTTWPLKLLIIWQKQVNNVTLPVPQAMVCVMCAACPFFPVWSSPTKATAHGGGYWPPQPPWGHSGLCRDHTRALQSGPSVWQVDLWISDEVRKTDQHHEL